MSYYPLTTTRIGHIRLQSLLSILKVNPAEKCPVIEGSILDFFAPGLNHLFFIGSHHSPVYTMAITQLIINQIDLRPKNCSRSEIEISHDTLRKGSDSTQIVILRHAVVHRFRGTQVHPEGPT